MACPFAIDYCEAIPIPIDIEKEAWQLDVSKIEEKINKRLGYTVCTQAIYQKKKIFRLIQTALKKR